MHYVVRDPNGSVVSLHREPVDGAEVLPSQHPDVQAFLGPAAGTRAFAEMDASLVRVLEDLIDALLRRNVLRITDLPLEAQVKLFERKHFRENMQGSALNLFGSQSPELGGDAGGVGAGLGDEGIPSGLIPPDWSGPDTPSR